MSNLAAVAMTAMAALVVQRVYALRRKLSAVDPELLGPAMAAMFLPMNAATLPVLRRLYRIKSEAGPDVTTTTRYTEDGNVRVMVFTPKQQAVPRPAVLYLHGGGMCVGTPEIEAVLAGDLVKEVGAVVVSPEYRLAPEHPFPAALDDCMATLGWMIEHADDLGIDCERIAVHGVSAGGGLTAAVAQRAFDEGIPLRAQALSYPMLDDRTALRDGDAGRGQIAWTSSSNTWAWTAYLGRRPRMADAPQYSAPVRRQNVAGLAAAWIGIGDLDLLYDESVDYAEKLTAAGVPCELVTVPGMYHAADNIAQKAPSMKRFRASMIGFLRTHLDAAE